MDSFSFMVLDNLLLVDVFFFETVYLTVINMRNRQKHCYRKGGHRNAAGNHPLMRQ